MRYLPCLGLMLILGISARSQTQPRFDVASVKPSATNDGAFRAVVRPDGVAFSNVPLRSIVAVAHGMGLFEQPWKVTGGPEELMSARFSISAKTSERATPADIRGMLRALLGERFGLKAREEMREMSVYALTRARPDRLGKDLQPTKAANCLPYWDPVDGLATFSGVAPSRCPSAVKVNSDGSISKIQIGPIEALMYSLKDIVISRPIVDATGLEGWFEWRLRYQVEPPDNPDAPPAPFVLDALPEQLGLKLESRRAPIQVLVIDSIQRPTPD